jgi:hypothetical protein
LNRFASVFRVKSLPPHVTLIPHQLKPSADESKPLVIKYSSPNVEELNEDIVLELRGGKPIKLPFKVKTTVPDVRIH